VTNWKLRTIRRRISRPLNANRARVELVAVLVGTTADPNERDGVVSRLEACAPVENASWNLRTTD
jgi:hypothetical protein